MHVFSLRAYGAGLRRQPEYEKDGHTGMILVKTPELRVVLEAAKAETRLATHVVHGPATLYVVSGALDVSTAEGTFRVGEAEMAVLPRDEEREISSAAESLFLIALSPVRTPDTNRV
jgi:quercetin dioxygenase-like cupin family protein